MFKFILNTFFVKLFLAGVKFLLNIVLARFLGAELRGLYYVLQNIIGFLSSFGTASIGEAYIYYHGKKRLSLITIKFFNILVIIFGGIFSSLCLLLVFESSLGSNLEMDIYFWPSLILCLLLIYEYLILQELKDRLKIYRSNIYYAISKVIFLLIIFFNGSELQPVDVIIYNIYAVISLVLLLLVPLFYYREISIWGGMNEFKNDLIKWKEYVLFSLKAHVGTILNLAEYRLDAIIAAFIIDLRLLGIYSVVLAIGQINYYLINSVNTVLFPNIVRGNVDIKGFLRVLRLSLFPVLLITIILALVTDSIDSYVFGDDYEDVGKYFVWMVPVILLESFNRLLATLMKSNNALGTFNKIALISILIYLPCLFLLANFFSLYGLILASFISYLIRAIMYIRWMKMTFPGQVRLRYFIPDIKETIMLIKNIMTGLTIFLTIIVYLAALYVRKLKIRENLTSDYFALFLVGSFMYNCLGQLTTMQHDDTTSQEMLLFAFFILGNSIVLFVAAIFFPKYELWKSAPSVLLPTKYIMIGLMALTVGYLFWHLNYARVGGIIQSFYETTNRVDRNAALTEQRGNLPYVHFFFVANVFLYYGFLVQSKNIKKVFLKLVY